MNDEVTWDEFMAASAWPECVTPCDCNRWECDRCNGDFEENNGAQHSIHYIEGETVIPIDTDRETFAREIKRALGVE